ncbi:MAG: division/cell wall cluster transcriptional repressor MraZ [Sphingomonadales bacterium]|nr:division/cell wall cluster transcriptional repressor MraZ [Sphingomonadales bacterium]
MLPAEFRKAVRDSSGGERILCLQVHPELKALIGFGLSREDELDAQLEREEENALKRGEPFNRMLRSSQLFGFSKIPFDDSGRFVMPGRFIKGANLGEKLFFQGAGSDFIIFNPDELMALGNEWAHAKMGCEECEEDFARKARK